MQISNTYIHSCKKRRNRHQHFCKFCSARIAGICNGIRLIFTVCWAKQINTQQNLKNLEVPIMRKVCHISCWEIFLKFWWAKSELDDSNKTRGWEVLKLLISKMSNTSSTFFFYFLQVNGQIYDAEVCHCVYAASRTFLNSFYTLGTSIAFTLWLLARVLLLPTRSKH